MQPQEPAAARRAHRPEDPSHSRPATKWVAAAHALDLRRHPRRPRRPTFPNGHLRPPQVQI